MKLLPALLLILLTTLPVLAGDPQPSQEKIDIFLTKLTASCKSAHIPGIKALSCFDGAPSGLIDQSIGFWEILLLEYPKTNGLVFKDAQYTTVDARLADSHGNPVAIKNSIDPQIRNGHPYTRNLSTVGFAIVTFSIRGASSSNIFPLGMDAGGSLKFSEWKRTDSGASAPFTPSPASPAVATMAPAPTHAQTDAFIDAIFTALQAGDLEACKARLFCFDGVPEELVDKEIDQWKTTLVDYAKANNGTFSKPTFTPLEDYLSRMGDGRKDAEASFGPKVMNGTTYRLNLPVAGMAGILMKTSHGTINMERVVGIDSTGTLKFVVQQPVAK